MEKCKTKLVPKLVKRLEKTIKTRTRRRLKETNAELKTVKNEDEKKKLTTRREIYLALLRPYTKTQKKRQKKTFEVSFCNPGCKGTIFEKDFDMDKFVGQTCKKNCKKLREMFTESRKTLLNGRKTLLDDDSFYLEFVDKEKKEKLQKEGALSGCSITVV
jgi:hypothetical protein